MDISILKIDGNSLLKIGSETVKVQDYKISSSMRGGTELEIIIHVDDNIMEFLISASREQ